jgi:acyl-CoA synthetase (AMP-forming)/AMP-acid ligase II
VYLEDARGTQTLSYAQLRQRADDWEHTLDRAGLPPGARVAVHLPDPLGYADALIGIIAAGRVAVPLDPAAPPADLSRVLKVAKPRAAVTATPAALPRSLPALPPALPTRAGGWSMSHRQYSMRVDESSTLTLMHRRLGGGAPGGGIFLSTSGTAGTPKGILLTDDQLSHVAACVVAHHRLTAADRGYCSLPLFHVNAEVVGLLATLAAQARLALDRKFTRNGFWQLIQEREITWINAVPAIITLLAADPPSAVATSVRYIRSASAPLPAAVLRRFEETAGIPVVETYGMTEAASMITANPLDGPRKPGSAGRAAGTEVRVRLDGLPCAPGVVGGVQIRGRGVITRYAEGGKRDAIDAEGWLDTGDLGYLDSGGYLFLAGRSDDVINRGGEKIYPREIEEVLLAQPGVRSAVVVGRPDEVLGARPVAYVVPEPAASGLEDDLRAACQASLPRYKQPSAYYLVGEMPLGPTGKVVRRRLAELAALALPASALRAPVR